MTVQCFMVRPAMRARRSLRRYNGSHGACPGRDGYHHAMAALDVVDSRLVGDGDRRHWETIPIGADPDHTDGRWPARCQACDYSFGPADEWQVFADELYLDDAGREFSLRDAVPGMMWDAFWAPAAWKGPDGLALTVVTPDGHQWLIDGPARNCTVPEDVGPFETAHRCWVRHGVPPLITVDKAGRTCAAGGGSIQTPGYHGFLRNGILTDG